MGISTLFSYCGAQIFESIGLSRHVVERYFTGTVSRIEGVDICGIAREVLARHNNAYGDSLANVNALEVGGDYKFRVEGETHMWTSETVSKLQHSTRNNDYDLYKEFADLINNRSRDLCTLRGLFDLKKSRKPISIDEVEPASEIVKRFVTGAMSYGSISKEAHEMLAIAMNRLGGQSNTGEGGEDPERFQTTSQWRFSP